MDVLQEKCEEQKNNGEMCDSESQRTMRNGTKDPSFQSRRLPAMVPLTGPQCKTT